MPNHPNPRRRAPVAVERRRACPRSSTISRSPRRRTPPALPLSRGKTPLLKPNKIVTRTSSEPILWTVRLSPDGADDGDDGDHVSSPPPSLPRPHTCTDVHSPVLRSLSHKSLEEVGCCNYYKEDSKVVVNVTVEGSPGPVRAMVRLGTSVEETIGLVVDRYGKEGRSPSLDRQDAASFQLHHSYFCLQSLEKTDKIGEVGGRSFYLRKSSSCSSSGQEGRDEETKLTNPPQVAITPPHLFISFILRRLSKFGRRTRKVWKILGCMACG